MPESSSSSAAHSTPPQTQPVSDAADFLYVGDELALFEKAFNWKSYWKSHIRAFVSGDVLEAGAGIGANTKLLSDLAFDSWTCLEPDANLLAEIELPSAKHALRQGTTENIQDEARFDTILYIDVLEHIEDDAAEMRRAARLLKPGGAVIVLSPAHQFLFSPFDAAIGHYRRYSLGTLAASAPRQFSPAKLVYLDSAGMLASAANRFLLSASMPTEQQILTWDRLLVPVSRITDRLTFHRLGKSVLGVWTKPDGQAR